MKALKSLLGVVGLFIVIALTTIEISTPEVEASGYTKKDQPGKVQHVSTTATTLLRRIRWSGGTSEIWFQNMSTNKNIHLSFDTATTKKFWTIPFNATNPTMEVFPVNLTEIWVYGDSTAAFEMLIFKRK